MDQLDSMNARGYGIGKRTHFHLFKWEKKDWIHIVEIVILTILNLGILPLLFQIFLLSDDHYASISDERSLVDDHDGSSVFITMHVEGKF